MDWLKQLPKSLWFRQFTYILTLEIEPFLQNTFNNDLGRVIPFPTAYHTSESMMPFRRHICIDFIIFLLIVFQTCVQTTLLLNVFDRKNFNINSINICSIELKWDGKLTKIW